MLLSDDKSPTHAYFLQIQETFTHSKATMGPGQGPDSPGGLRLQIAEPFRGSSSCRAVQGFSVPVPVKNSRYCWCAILGTTLKEPSPKNHPGRDTGVLFLLYGTQILVFQILPNFCHTEDFRRGEKEREHSF